MDPENNHQQDLAGGVDLANPVAKGIEDFKQKAMMAKATAIVMVAQAENGAVLFAAQAPGGEIQIRGLLSKGGDVLGQQAQQQQQGPRVG